MKSKNELVVRVNTAELLSTENDGKDIVMNPDAEDAIIKLLSIQRQVNDAVDQLKAEIERRVLAYNPNFTSVKGSKVKINYQAAGAKYKGETKNHCPKYWTKKVTWAINSKAVDEYYAKYYRLPAGIKAVERKKTIRISEVGDA